MRALQEEQPLGARMMGKAEKITSEVLDSHFHLPTEGRGEEIRGFLTYISRSRARQHGAV